MEGSLEYDDIRPPGGHPGQFERPLDGFRPAVGEEEAIQGGRQDAAQLLHQLQQRRVVDDVHLTVQEFGGLRLNRFHDSRVAVAGVGHPDATGEIQVGVPLPIVKVGSLPAFDDQVGVAEPGRREMANGIVHKRFSHQGRGPI